MKMMNFQHTTYSSLWIRSQDIFQGGHKTPKIFHDTKFEMIFQNERKLRYFISFFSLSIYNTYLANNTKNNSFDPSWSTGVTYSNCCML